MATAKKKLQLGEAVLKNPKEELFCWIYAGYHNKDLFGHGTKCYTQVFYADELAKLTEEIDVLQREKKAGYTVEVDIRDRRIKSLGNQARSLAARLLAKVSVRARVDYLIDSYISETHSDRELQYVILQRFDLNSKVQAIKEFNRLKDRGSKNNLEGNFTFAWEGAPESITRDKKKPIIKKAEIKQAPTVAWEGDEK